jgi:hypothetical protein
MNSASHYFNERVDIVRRLTEGSPDPVYSAVQPSCLFERFLSVGSNDVFACIRCVPDKPSLCDVLTVNMLKQVTAEVAPCLACLYNRS